MSRSHLKRIRNLLPCLVIPLAAFLVIGCSGSDGSTGATGPTGPAGPPGPVTASAESCAVCHSGGKIADIAPLHPDPTAKDQIVSNITLANQGGIPVVSFHVATADGPVTDVALSALRFYIADLVPAGTVTTVGTFDTPYFEQWSAETSTSGGNFVNNGSGNYTYTFTTSFGTPTGGSGLNHADFNTSHVQRLVLRATGTAGVTNNTVGFLDFNIPASGATAVALDSQRQFVTIDACKKCHGPRMDEAAHANGYLDTRACDICHSPFYGSSRHAVGFMNDDKAILPVFIHQIHAAIANPIFSAEVYGLGFGGVTYPQDVKNCVVCHTNSGLNLGTGDQTNNWKTHPTAQVCGSCHTTMNFITGENHPGGVQLTNNYCIACHPASGPGFGKSITAGHDTTPTGVNVPEFDVTLGITQPTNGSYYQAGETPTVTVTLKDHASGLPVDPAIYTTPQDTKGVAGGGLNVASLYVYGPRAKAVPVLATGTVTDPAFKTGTPTQGHNLFVGGTDPQVMTDSSGFKYKLLPIPADMKAGTYMVRVRIGDYGYVSDTNYHIESTDFADIQVGTATVENKVAGAACINCHGTGTAPWHDARHAVVVDTDECLSCHDQSGNHAVPIANRVHAVHDANSAGDIYNIDDGGVRDWSIITYPQDISRCVTCHNSGDTTYKSNPFMMPCAGCHVSIITSAGTTSPDDPTLGHMRQNGGHF